MKKDEKMIYEMLGFNESMLDNARITSDTLRKVVNILEYLMNEVRIVLYFIMAIGFVVQVLFFRVFLYSPISTFLGQISEWFFRLSESWKIAIVVLILSVPATIVATVIGHFIIKGIEDRFKRL